MNGEAGSGEKIQGIGQFVVRPGGAASPVAVLVAEVGNDVVAPGDDKTGPEDGKNSHQAR